MPERARSIHSAKNTAVIRENVTENPKTLIPHRPLLRMVNSVLYWPIISDFCGRNRLTSTWTAYNANNTAVRRVVELM